MAGATRRDCPLATPPNYKASHTVQVTYDLYKKYGEFRLLDTPICEYSFLVRSHEG